MIDKATKKPRGFGFVTFKRLESVEKVMQMKDSLRLRSKKIDCKRAQPKEELDHVTAEVPKPSTEEPENAKYQIILDEKQFKNKKLEIHIRRENGEIAAL